ncbi:peptidase S28 [Xylaria palmicola]|nr:peptidase S28 [Xylaria palmicola]
MELTSSVFFWLFCCSGLLSSLASAFSVPPRQRLPRTRRLQQPGGASSALESRSRPAYYFDQAIDHFPHSSRYVPHAKGTFKQRYFVETAYYKPGGPVFLYLGGEGAIDGDTHLDASLIEQFMKRFNGIGVVLENRYYGTSVPFNTTTTDELAYLTTEQVIADFDAFARKAKLPNVAANSTTNAPSTPWIVYGGSYSGALSAFTIKTYSGTFHGAIASSGVIHGQTELPQWYDPIQALAPQDCVASINDIVDQMDALVRSGDATAVRQFQDIFGLGALGDVRDFAQTIAFPLGGPFFYPSYTWQEINWNPAFGHQDFFRFCDAVTNASAAPAVAAVDTALARYTGGRAWKNLGNYAAYIKAVILPLCASGDYDSPECFGTQHPDWWADTANGAERSWLYTTCTEFGAYQAAQPHGKKSLLSRVVDKTYTQQWCNWAFPKGKYNSIPASPDHARWNVYGDFALRADRLLFVDGSADPWKDLCWHSDLAPPRPAWDAQPQHLVNGAGHVWDLRTLEDVDAEPQFIGAATRLEIRTVETWLREFGSSKSAL